MPKPDALPTAERVPSREALVAEQTVRVGERVRQWVSDDAARARVADVRDVYWQHVEEELAQGFVLDWSAREHGPVRALFGAALSEWQGAAQAYAQGRPPLADSRGQRSLQADLLRVPPEDRGLRGTVLDAPVPAITLETLGRLVQDGDTPFHTRLTAFVRIKQRSDGSVDDVSLEARSGSPTYDQLVLAQARTLGRHGLGPPPGTHRESLWAFETVFDQAPPVPLAGCALGDTFLPRDCFYPLKRTVKSRLHLEALD